MSQVGYANVGEVVAAGSEVGVRPGQRVYSMGTHASVVRIDARDRFCVPVPDDLSDERAVFVRLANVSMTTMRTTIARGGDRVAVIGLGLIGNLAAQVFQACGMRVNAVDLSPARGRSPSGAASAPSTAPRPCPTWHASTGWSSRRPARPRRWPARSGWRRTAARS